MKTKLYGWYNSSPTSNGNVVLTYWNKIVNDYPSVGESHNDPKRYSKEHYVESVKRFIDDHLNHNPTRKFIIDIPVAEVWWMGTKIGIDGFEEVIPEWKTIQWVQYIVEALDSHPNIIGWYHADEPEVWGYREIVNGNPMSNTPVIPYYLLKQRYDSIKLISDKPVIAVFCDVPLFYKRYYTDIKTYGAFFDVFGFDHYPFLVRGKDHSLDKIKQFINTSNKINPAIPIMFVGQGSGSDEFNTRSPNLKEHQQLYTEFTKWCPPSKRFAYLLWAYDWADDNSVRLGEYVLQSEKLYSWEYTSLIHHIIAKIKSYIRKFFKNNN